jgi:hypothetical protein
MFMSAAATSLTPTNRPSRAERLLGLVRKLIDYGRELAATLHQRAATDLLSVACNFGTRDLGLILASITRGLLRARALEARLERNAARLDAEPTRRDPPAQRRSRSDHPAASPVGAADPRPGELSLEEQIAAEVRGRPIGVVIADICRDLGIVASHPLWREISLAIIREGGHLVPVLRKIADRVYQISAPGAAAAPPAWPAPSPAPASTGPP